MCVCVSVIVYGCVFAGESKQAYALLVCTCRHQRVDIGDCVCISLFSYMSISKC